MQLIYERMLLNDRAMVTNNCKYTLSATPTPSMTSSNNSLPQILRQIQETSDAIYHSVSRSGFSRVFTIPDHPVEPLALPAAPDILPELKATGAPSYFILREVENFKKSCLILRQWAEKTYSKITQDIPGACSPSSAFQSAHLLRHNYLRCTYELSSRAIMRAQRVSHQTSSRAPFNQVRSLFLDCPLLTFVDCQESIPLLTKYFKANAFPSAAARFILAQKTAMTPRQIEIWVRPQELFLFNLKSHVCSVSE